MKKAIDRKKTEIFDLITEYKELVSLQVIKSVNT